VCVEELSAEFCVGRVSDFAQFYPQWQWRHVGLLSERSFLAIIDMFVIKLENIQVVNYVETTVEWEQWPIADSDSE